MVGINYLPWLVHIGSCIVLLSSNYIENLQEIFPMFVLFGLVYYFNPVPLKALYSGDSNTWGSGANATLFCIRSLPR